MTRREKVGEAWAVRTRDNWWRSACGFSPHVYERTFWTNADHARTWVNHRKHAGLTLVKITFYRVTRKKGARRG